MKSLDIVIPVYNGGKDIENCINSLIRFFQEIKFPYRWNIVISDNGSIDKTNEIGKTLSKKHSFVHYLHTNQKGRGIALRNAFLQSKADIVSYMDVDLAVKLEAFPRLIEEVVKGSDICIGSRLISESKVKRSFKREMLSRGYNTLLKVLFQNKFSDAQCGFKAYKAEVVKKILPLVKDNEWFFDSELLIIAEKKGYKIKEIPIIWSEGGSTTVNMKNSIKLLKNSIKFKKDLMFK